MNPDTDPTIQTLLYLRNEIEARAHKYQDTPADPDTPELRHLYDGIATGLHIAAGRIGTEILRLRIATNQPTHRSAQ